MIHNFDMVAQINQMFPKIKTKTKRLMEGYYLHLMMKPDQQQTQSSIHNYLQNWV